MNDFDNIIFFFVVEDWKKNFLFCLEIWCYLEKEKILDIIFRWGMDEYLGFSIWDDELF